MVPNPFMLQVYAYCYPFIRFYPFKVNEWEYITLDGKHSSGAEQKLSVYLFFDVHNPLYNLILISKNSILFCFSLLAIGSLTPSLAQSSIINFNGRVDFYSDAPQEQIRAESEQLIGVIDTVRKTFAFQVPVKSFLGFNSELQRQHFNENYMESNRYPQLSYTGKILGNISYHIPGEYIVKSKGSFRIHGIEKEEIIENTVTIKESGISVSSDFFIRLADYNIHIPRIVQKKIAPKISIRIQAKNSSRP